NGDGEDRKHSEEEIAYDLSPEMEHLLQDRPDDLQSIIEAAVSEAEAKALLHQQHKDAGFPSFATFLRALHDPEFNDVKKREKNFHCRCATCAELQTRLRQASRSPAARATYEALLKQHHFEVKHWRALEDSMHTL